jgi:hypothetical protein
MFYILMNGQLSMFSHTLHLVCNVPQSLTYLPLLIRFLVLALAEQTPEFVLQDSEVFFASFLVAGVADEQLIGLDVVEILIGGYGFIGFCCF